MKRTTHAARAAALAGAVALVLTACSGDADDTTDDGAEADPGTSDSSPLIIGSLLPVTGSLAFLGPPEVAGVDLAIQEINEAGGVNGVDVEIVHTDSGDAENMAVAIGSVDDMLSQGVHVIIGAASSSVTYGVIDTIVEAEVVQFSPANTSPGLSGYSDYYFRTAPPDSVQGNALGNLIAGDGHERVGILVFNDDYGTGLRAVVEETLVGEGVEVTYGTVGANEEFAPKQNNYEAEVQAVLATDPDAIALIAFEETAVIVPQLVQAGFDTSNLYFTDGNTANYPDLDAGVLEGAKGTIPGAFPSDEFQERLLAVDSGLTEYSYSAESYDAVILSALAAAKGGQNDAQTVQANLHAVSGADGGEECSTYADCIELIDAGEEIMYVGQAGVGPFNADNDPSSAFVGIYVYDAENTITWTEAIFGEIS
ncbi:ABC transporter substrate-binding protein [Actinotalea sp. K2]|uniref:ABC transporter substrate-binding protein n=1 Tax=Actinotalea sp. K2 TaxID=2939438 RepID=UPI00201838E4|nr:ABC transporter substrate-binding protein [Actinotalea sp. K2]MCL3861993.1 ABC transporter substrate-binding protein [Actinotalea sp. K2]